MDRPVFRLSKDFKHALDLIDKEGVHAFVTGRAGTGKSTLLRLFKQLPKRKRLYWRQQVSRRSI